MAWTTDGGHPPIVCDMSSAPDTPAERMAEYGQLFARHLLGRERTAAGIRFRFRADPGVQDWVRDLAAREKACCAFFDIVVQSQDQEIWWDLSTEEDDLARQILDEFYRLPQAADAGIAVREALAGRGLRFGTAQEDASHQVTRSRDERP